MAYEIPQQLEYKEKIMFGLTFKQLAYLFLFAPTILFIVFRTDLHIAIKAFLCANLGALAIGFIFLNLDQHIRNWLHWYKSRKIEKPHRMAKFIPIKEVKNDFIITHDNKRLAILKIDPINFSIKPDESKQAIAAAFQKFLNSLDFPIQIVMNTESLDLNSYLKEVEEKAGKSKKFEELFVGYKRHLESIIKESDVMNRNFFLILPEKNDINIQLQICQGKLSNIGLKSFRLKDGEISNFLRRFFDAKKGFYPLKIENYPTYIKIVREEWEVKNNVVEKKETG